MERLKRRALLYLVSLLAAIAAFTVLYQFGMLVFEGERRGPVDSLMVVIQTYTTVGYGQDAPSWRSAEMNLVMVAMQITGVTHLFVTLPLFVVPWVQDALERRPPEAISGVTDHVVVCETFSLGHTLLEELKAREVPYVLVEPDAEVAQAFHEHGFTTVRGDPEDVEALVNAGIATARAVVVDSTDERAPSIVLAVRSLKPDLPVSCVLRERGHVPYVTYAGATTVLSPREALGRSLALKAATAVTHEVGEAVEVGRDLRIVELPVMPASAVCDRRLADSRIRERTGASVLGVWLKGDFIASPPPDVVLDERSVLLVAGKADQLEALKELTRSEARAHRRGKVVVLGYGEVGRAAAAVLRERGMEATIVHPGEDEDGDVDVAGDATDEDALARAGVADAAAVVVTLPADTKAIFAILVARELNPSVEIIARANEPESIPKMYRAGADYVLSLANVAARMLARSVFGEEVMTPARQVKMVRVAADRLAGRSLREANVGSRTGCTVVAVERDGEVMTDLGPDFVVMSDDRVVVAGTDEDVQRYDRTFGA